MKYKLGEIVEKDGRRYVYTTEGLLPLKKTREKPVFNDLETIRKANTGNKTRIELVKTKMTANGKESILYTLKKVVSTKDGDIVAKSFAIPEDIAKQFFKL